MGRYAQLYCSYDFTILFILETSKTISRVYKLDYIPNCNKFVLYVEKNTEYHKTISRDLSKLKRTVVKQWMTCLPIRIYSHVSDMKQKVDIGRKSKLKSCGLQFLTLKLKLVLRIWCTRMPVTEKVTKRYDVYWTLSFP
jgi:hypothetical protein